MIVVFDLADGSQAAVHTFCMDTCFVVGPQPVQPLTLDDSLDHGPLVDPFVAAARTCASVEHPTCDQAVRLAIDGATADGFLTGTTIERAHYYVVYLDAERPNAAATDADYIVDIYIAAEHGIEAERATGVDCSTVPCRVVPL